MGSATAELFIVVMPGEPSKFGFCVTNDLETCDQFSSSPRVSMDHDQHSCKGSEGINPLVERVNHDLNVLTPQGFSSKEQSKGR